MWSKVGADHWGPIPDGSNRYILVIQDYLTKYPEAVLVNSTATKHNIPVMEEVFGRHGYPNKMITDNGAPWNGKETQAMKQYLKWAGIDHQPTFSAEDPEANGLAERFMQEIGNSWETAYVEGVDPISSLNSKLKMYRNTEHAVTKRKPAEWLFGRPIRTRLPNRQLQTQREDEEGAAAKRRIVIRGEKEKIRRDAKAREEVLTVGDTVLLKKKCKRKGYPRYDPLPYTLIDLIGRQAVIQRGSSILRRETNKIKKFSAASLHKDEIGDSEEDDWEEDILRSTAEVIEPEPENDKTEIAVVDDTTHHVANPVPRQQETISVPTRKSTRARRSPDRFGSWVRE